MQKHYRKAIWGMALCWLGAAAAIPAMAQTLTVAGSMPGQFSVNESGAATYRIPLQVPPGVAGMEPKLELAYNSQSGNGLLGMGWSLSGLSAISRCPRTMVQDGVRGGINFDMSDRYCMDGQRLILVSGTYGVAGSEYKTELDSFSKIAASGTAGNGVASFTVQTKAGLRIEYGNTADSRIEAQGKSTVRVWAISKISDVKTNFMTFSYIEDNANGDFYPSRIDYAGSGAAQSQSVQFGVEGRADILPGYAGGSLQKTAKRLKSVQTYLGTSLVKDYRIAYNTNPTTGRSRVISVLECDSVGACLKPTESSYSSASASGFASFDYWTPVFGQGWYEPQYYTTIQYVDLNGDGVPDVCGRWGGGISCGLNLKTSVGFAAPTVWTTAFGVGWDQPQNYSTIRYVDLNGDGLVDVCGRSDSGIVCLLNLGTGAGFAAPVLWTSTFGSGWYLPQNYSTIQYVDLNGDGLPDICGRSDTGVVCALNLGTGAGFGAPSVWASLFGVGWYNHQNYSTIQYVDLNGDGLPDICARSDGGIICALNLGTGAGFGTPVSWTTTFGVGWNEPQNYSTIRYIDLNGDGLADVCGRSDGGIVCALNPGTGAGFSAPVVWTTTFGSGWSLPQNYSTIQYVDLNGDGLPDICGRSDTGMVCALNLGTGAGFAAPVVWTATFGAGWYNAQNYSTIQYVDLNGDGLPDICGRSDVGILCGMSSARMENQVAQISVAGSPTNISYKPLTSSSVYAKDTAPNASVYPKLDLLYPQYVVSSVANSNGIGGTVTTQYNYGGLKAELGAGRGMLGFRWMKSKNLANNIESYTEFNQNWPLTGSVAKSETRLAGSGNAGILKRTTNTYAQGAGSVAGTTFVYPSQSVEESWDLGGAAYPTVTNAYQYGQSPQYGDPTQISVINSAGAGKTTVNEYWPANTGGGSWVLGRLKKATVTSTAP